LNPDTTFQPNSSRITYEIIEGETIIVDFETGVYYSINALGSAIFSWIVQGATAGAILSAIEEQYEVYNAGYDETINQFIESLLHEGIINRNNISKERGQVSSISFDTLDSTTFIPPAIEKYTDMQELLLLDPIHEVDEEGWPFTQQDESNIAS
jgi:hypothetical protein